MLCFLLLILIILGLYKTNRIKENFIDNYCSKYNDCKTCAESSGCSWCPKSQVCLSNNSLKSTDKNCNQMNTISSGFRCSSEIAGEFPNNGVQTTKHFTDKTLWEDKIANKLPPANVGISDTVYYSNEDLTSNMNQIRNTTKNLITELPSIISTTVEDQIAPMVKGILSSNHYNIQGFTDFQNKKPTCKQKKTCDDCVNMSECGWYPLESKCDTRGPNKNQYVTDKQRCITTPSTLNIMRSLVLV